MSTFDAVDSQVSFPAVEERVLAFWREHETFRKSLENRRDREEFVFFDGPPFATGLPHYGHLLAGTIKDVVPRYQTMRGKYVRRTFGWDCHGLPVENEMEKELGISSKSQIEELGVAKFNEACRGIVLRHTGEWEVIVERMGRWVDFANGYRTMDRDYMESIWWVVRQLWDKGLVYEGQKIVPYCPRCATPLSNFEANQGYEDVQDPSICVRFQSRRQANLYFLAWTTTPWTLPSNLALCVGPAIEYVHIRATDGNEYILAASRLSCYYDNPEMLRRFPGRELIGELYEPLLPYFAELREQGAFRVIAADFVTTDNGTGIVHIAPGFGEDDAAAAREYDLPSVCPIDAECRFTAEVPEYAGIAVKQADKAIIRRLKDDGSLVQQSTYQHSYPHCWRCEEPLIYRAVATWFVHVEKLKDRMMAANQKIRWVPEHLKDGRFGKWLENARDWAISRNRYWGCPLPLWRNDQTGEVVCMSSIAELEQLTGRQIPDIHKHFVDELTFSNGNGTFRRVEEVLDCWFESGSMPYAEHHYPFANQEHVEAHFPADFIAEGLDQTRGWFYSLVVLAAALFDKPPFRNVVVNGLILAEDGRKMSKRLKNYPDPMEVMQSSGADALRLCLLSSQVVRGEDLRFSDRAVREVLRTVILPVWNAYSFFVTYARVDGWQPAAVAAPPPHCENLLDRWMLSRLQATVADVQQAMDNYDLQHAAVRFTAFVDELTNWYIRRSRRRFWKSQNDVDKDQAYATLHYVLVTFAQIAAPFIPFVTEAIYRNLRTAQMPESVHLCDFPRSLDNYRDEQLEQRMAQTITAVSLGRYLRTQNDGRVRRVRQPLAEAVLVSADAAVRQNLHAMQDVIGEELNVKTVIIGGDEEELVELSAKANFKTLGQRLGKRMKEAAQLLESLELEQIQRLRQGQTLDMQFADGEVFAITLDDVMVKRTEKPGLAVANEGAVTVALDTRLTPALLQEGWAREIVNRIQTIRKELDLQVDARIMVSYDLPVEMAAAVEVYRDYIQNETLAVQLIAGELHDAVNTEIDGQPCWLAVARVN